jgi:hypothetical protein
VSGALVTPVTPDGTSNTRAQGEQGEPYARKGVTRGDGVTGGLLPVRCPMCVDGARVSAVDGKALTCPWCGGRCELPFHWGREVWQRVKTRQGRGAE